MRKVDPIKYEEKRSEILAAAGRCFVRDGFQGTSTSAICIEANISAGHLYHYFDSKEAIIAAMVKANLARALAYFNQLVETEHAVSALMIELAKLDVMINRPVPPLALDIFAEAGRNPALAALLQEHSQSMQTLLAGLIYQGQIRGEIDPDLDPQSAATLLISLIDGTKNLGVRYAYLDVEQTAATLKLMISRFLSPAEK